MNTHGSLFRYFGLTGLALLCASGIATSQEGNAAAAAIGSLSWRNIGPANMGGRVSDIVGIPGNRNVFYVGGADGGVFKTINGGITFEEQFNNEWAYSVGALAVAPSDPNVIWLGSGEGDPRNSVSYGNGVYRSVDGGKTWMHLGLDNTERIKRIAVHPGNPDHAYVCAMGHEWGPNPERGVFRTTDAGHTWDHVLSLNEDTGCSELVMDATNPRVLYVGMWTFRRRPWRFDDGGGETALYKTVDGGSTWDKKTEGLPEGPMARIGLAVSSSHPNIVYLITEAVDEGVLFRSDDWGETWRMVHDDPNINFRPFYYSDIRVDPNNPEVVYSLAGGLSKSTDGGRTFDRIAGGVHGDHQAFWIDPEDSNRLLSGSDGGFQVSNDAGANWDVINNVTLSQFYQIFYDDQQPYYVCGGLQDNGSWCGPSNSLEGVGILKSDWFRISGGDGFYSVPVPGAPHLNYSDLQGGVIMLTDTRTGNTRQIHPYPNKMGSAGDAIAEHQYRYNWDAPIHISPHDPATVYFGGNVLFKTTDEGYSWEVISPDLTTNDKSKQQTSGGLIYQDNTAAEFHSTILTIAESPVERGVIWVGTDDGFIQVTRDGGATWTNVTDRVRGLPEFAWVAKIEASFHDGATAFVAVDHHRMDDFTPYVFKTTDYGRSWTALHTGLPQDDYVKVVREDTRNPNLLYVGMDRGLYASWDGGTSWASIRNNLPPVSVRDIKVHPRENDLIIGTHGRGAWILDDVTPLQQLGVAVSQEAHLFEVRPAIRWHLANRTASLGQRTYRGTNPPYGATINFYLREAPDGPVTLTVTDAAGNSVRRLRSGEVTAGVNRVMWDLRYTGDAPDRGGPGGGGGFRGPGGAPVVPGEYTIALDAGGQQLSTTVRVEADPRIEMSAADYQAQFDAARELMDLAARMTAVTNTIDNLTRQLGNLGEDLGARGQPNQQAIESARTHATEEIAQLNDKLRTPVRGLGYRQTPRLTDELGRLLRSITGATARPTEPQLLRLGELRDESVMAEGELNRIVEGPIRELNEMLGASPRIVLGARGGGR